MTDGPEHLRGYRLRDYDHLIATLGRSRESQHITTVRLAAAIHDHNPNITRTLKGITEARGRRLFALADALGYDLALIPHDTEETP